MRFEEEFPYMSPNYDVVILGCGEAGIFAAYELTHLHPGLKVLALDQGQDIYHRSCPIVAGKVKECIHCPVCHTMCGFGGAGAFSDGKFNFTTQFGGWLTDFIEPKEVMDLIDYVDSINVAHGATTQCFSTTTPEAKALERRALAYDLHLLQARAPRTTCASSPTSTRVCGTSWSSASTPRCPTSPRPTGAIA